jgi:hypothetical protein
MLGSTLAIIFKHWPTLLNTGQAHLSMSQALLMINNVGQVSKMQNQKFKLMNQLGSDYFSLNHCWPYILTVGPA